MPKLDIGSAEVRTGSSYAAPYDEPCRGLWYSKLGTAAGLTQFGVNLKRIPPGQWSSQRHWHAAEDEFVWVVSGELVLVTDEGEALLRAGDCAGFKAGAPNGHHLQNRSGAEAVVLEVGSRQPGGDSCTYPDVDGTPY